VKPETFGKVGVLLGGWSVEREVSLLSGEMVCQGLEESVVDVHAVDVIDGAGVIKQLLEEKYDRVFNVLHGRGGEDGVLQGLLETLAIPYTGSGVTASAIAMNKLLSKNIWQAHNLPMAKHFVLEDMDSLGSVGEQLGYPLMLKPVAEGSSVGVCKIDDLSAFGEAFTEHQTLGQLMAEQYIDGDEYTISILDGDALPVIRLETNNTFYDYEAKYLTDDTRYHIPCGLSLEQESELQQLALSAFNFLGASGWGRVDVMRDQQGNNYLIELNTQPGMTDHSLVPKAAAAAGISYQELVTRILHTSFVQESCDVS